MTFSQKETLLLQDLRSKEELCVEKYTKYEHNAVSPELKTLMGELRKKEEEHVQTICKLMNGELPNMTAGQSGQQQTPTPAGGTAQYASNQSGFENDKFLCSDALSTEKHVSATYNTCIFEFKNPQVRNILNHIQKEEQEHGEKLYKFMSQSGMYN